MYSGGHFTVLRYILVDFWKRSGKHQEVKMIRIIIKSYAIK